MRNLSSPRIVPSQLFTQVGIAYAGPIQIRAIKGRGNISFKEYLSLFVCFFTKAIHLEAVVKSPRKDSKIIEQSSTSPSRPRTQIISFNSNQNLGKLSSDKQRYPPVIWVVGGPGSNKAYICATASKEVGWTHISLGKLLRAAAESISEKPTIELQMLKEYICNGDMVPLNIIMKYIESNMNNNRTATGIILDGFPRDINQATYFESKFKQKPTIILLDCSKLQLGRGRLDDSVTAFRKRLEIFRHASLPMLKTMDNIGRLIIIDGDTDTKPVQEEFTNIVKDLIAYIDHKKKSSVQNIKISTFKENSIMSEIYEKRFQQYYSNKRNIISQKEIPNNIIKLKVNNILSMDQYANMNLKYKNENSETNKINEHIITH